MTQEHAGHTPATKRQAQIIILLLVVSCIIGGISIIKPSKVSTDDIISAIEQVEAIKVGGQENFKLLQKVSQSEGFKQQTKQQFEIMLEDYEKTTK